MLTTPKKRSSTIERHFHLIWVANWGLPLAAIADLKNDEEVIYEPMTSALPAYSYVWIMCTLSSPFSYML